MRQFITTLITTLVLLSAFAALTIELRFHFRTVGACLERGAKPYRTEVSTTDYDWAVGTTWPWWSIWP